MCNHFDKLCDILKALSAKYNELESLKEYINDEESLKLINAKLDTIEDIIHLVDSELV